MNRKALAFILTSALLVIAFKSQPENNRPKKKDIKMTLNGKIKSRFTDLNLPLVKVILISKTTNDTIQEVISNKHGNYKLDKLQLDNNYTISYTKERYLSRIIDCDTRGISNPKENKLTIRGDISLMDYFPQFDSCINASKIESTSCIRIKWNNSKGEFEFGRTQSYRNAEDQFNYCIMVMENKKRDKKN